MSLIPLAAAALLAAVSSPALADEIAASEPNAVALSERRAAEAFQAYTRKDYTGAVALYLEAYEAAPSGSILYNVARIYDLKLGDRPLAMNFYRRYIADPGSHTELIVDANQRLRELREAELAASRPEKSRASGRTIGEDAPAALPVVSEGTEEPGGWSTSRWIGVAAGVVGVVGVGVGAGFGLAAMSKAGTANRTCQGNACTSQAGVDAARDGRRDATRSNIGFAAGGALLVVGGTLFWWGAERTVPHTSRADIRWGTRATPSELSMQVSGRW